MPTGIIGLAVLKCFSEFRFFLRVGFRQAANESIRRLFQLVGFFEEANCFFEVRIQFLLRLACHRVLGKLNDRFEFFQLVVAFRRPR